MDRILPIYGVPKETAGLKHQSSPDGDTDLFDIVIGILQEDTLIPYMCIIYLDYVQQTSIDLIKVKGFIQKTQKADDIRQKIWQTQTTQMISCFFQILLPKLNPYYIAKNKHQDAST